MTTISVNWEQKLKSDWPVIANSVAKEYGVDAKSLLEKLPIPNSSELAVVAETIINISDIIKDGFTPEALEGLASELAISASTMLVGTALGSAVPGLGNVVGLAVGALVGGIMDSFFGPSAKEKEAALRKEKDKIITAVSDWEDNQLDAAWTSMLVAVSPNERGYAIIGRFSKGDQTYEDEVVADPFIDHAKKTLKSWGFNPSKGDRDWKAAQKAWDNPFPKRRIKLSGKGGTLKDKSGKVITVYEYKKDGKWYRAEPTPEERFKAYTDVVKRRVDHDSKAIALYNAYTAETKVIRDLFTEAAKLEPKKAFTNFSIFAPVSKEILFPLHKKNSSGGSALLIPVIVIASITGAVLLRKNT